jgi:hypothetical protein
MEPAVRSPRTEPAVADLGSKGRLAQKAPKIPEFPNGLGACKPNSGERNFWMQRREAKIGLRDRKVHRRPKEQKDTVENPHRNGPF